MWSSPEKEIPSHDIRAEHFRILENATEQAEDFDPRTPEVYSALDSLQTSSCRSWGFTVYREGLEICNAHAMRMGLALIKQHLGLQPDIQQR